MLWDSLICILGWVIIACHTWSLRAHFDMPEMPSGVRVISFLVILSAVTLTFLTFFYSQPHWPQLIGFAMLVVSFIVFWITIRESSNAKLLAAFDEKLPHGLLKTGPYSVVRHPFYTSYLIQWIGWAIAAWHPAAIVPVVLMTVTYWNAARGEEAKFAKTDMAEEYAAYMKTTGRFFPKLIR